MTDPDVDRLASKVAKIKDEFLNIGELRLGSLFFRYRKCGKAGCVCQKSNHPGHGVWVVSKTVAGGRTVMSTVADEELLPTVRAQLEEGRRFWHLCTEFAENCDELAKARLRQEAGAKATAKKGGSKKPSPRKSRPRSTRS